MPIQGSTATMFVGGALCALAAVQAGPLEGPGGGARRSGRVEPLELRQKMGVSGGEAASPAPVDHCAGVIGAAGRLFLCSQPFVPDGDIREFINWNGDGQEYFITDWTNPDRGKIKSDAFVCADLIVLDSFPREGEGAAGPTGFEDWPRTWAHYPSPTGFNLGRLFVSFDPTQDPDGDSSNGSGVYFLALDISAPRSLDLLGATQPVAFDVDGDGRRTTVTEIDPRIMTEVPLLGEDLYFFGIDTDSDDRNEVFVMLGEQWASVPGGAVPIDPGGVPQIIKGFQVRRYVKFGDRTRTLPGTSEEHALRFLDARLDGAIDWRDFGVGADIELAVLNVTALPHNDDPYDVTFTARADASDDVLWESAEDQIIFHARFPVRHTRGTCGDEQARR